MTIVFNANNLIANQNYYTSYFVSNGYCKASVSPLSFGSITCGIKIGINGAVKPLAPIVKGKLNFSIPEIYKNSQVRLILVPSVNLASLKIEFIETYQYDFKLPRAAGVSEQLLELDKKITVIGGKVDALPIYDSSNDIAEIKAELGNIYNIVSNLPTG